VHIGVIKCTFTTMTRIPETTTRDMHTRSAAETHFVHMSVQCAWTYSDSNIAGSRQRNWRRSDTDYCYTG